MATAGNDVGEEKRTGYTFRGLPIILSKTRGRPPTGKMEIGKSGWWHEKKKIEAITLFAATGNFSKCEELSGVPKATIAKWIKEPWALDLLDEIRSENDQKIDAKFNQIVDSALDKLGERLENGDEVVLKSGEKIRKAIGAKDLAQISGTIIDRRQLLRGKPTSRTETVSEGSRLKKLEEQFLKLANRIRKPPQDIQDVEYSEITQNDPALDTNMGVRSDLNPAEGSPKT